MSTQSQPVPPLCLTGLEAHTLPATALAQGLVLPGAAPIHLSTAGASTRARYHGSARVGGSSWPSRLPGARGAL
jgi:hypothetical protein